MGYSRMGRDILSIRPWYDLCTECFDASEVARMQLMELENEYRNITSY